MTEYNGVSHGFKAVFDLASLVNIEKLVAFKDFSASLYEDIFNLSCKDFFGNYKA